MSDVTVKICGLMREADVRLCLDLGVDVLGFVTEYPVPVPWNLHRDEVRPLLERVRPPRRSCLVTGGPPEKVIALASALRPSLVQLHYRETLADTLKITEALGALKIGILKTVPPEPEERLHQFGTTELAAIVQALNETGIHALLADSRVPSRAAQQGAALDLDFCRDILRLSSKPVILAGGIHADNVRDILEQTGAAFIDVMTGVERAPGEKDAALLRRLLAAVHR
jgi:phosphoribosylanthranilate isomerase